MDQIKCLPKHQRKRKKQIRKLSSPRVENPSSRVENPSSRVDTIKHQKRKPEKKKKEKKKIRDVNREALRYRDTAARVG